MTTAIREIPSWRLGAVTRAAGRAALGAVLAWRERAHQRRGLQMLDDRLLRDVGLTRLDVEFETQKPFWRV